MTGVYTESYIERLPGAIGNMLQYATGTYGMDGGEILSLFIQTGMAEAIESGSPLYCAGKSGIELFFETMEKSGLRRGYKEEIAIWGKSEDYWAGWILTLYFFHSGRSFRKILSAVPYTTLLSLYYPLHEAAPEKAFDVLDSFFTDSRSGLKNIRKVRGLTQEELSCVSGVSLNTIRAYERGAKDIRKAGVAIILSLSDALCCSVRNLVGL